MAGAIFRESKNHEGMADVAVDKRIVTFHPGYQAKKDYEPSEAYQAFSDHLASSLSQEEDIAYAQMIGDPTKSLCDCLCFWMKRRKWRYASTFYEQTELHSNYYNRIQKDEMNNMGTQTLMAICVGLQLPLRIIQATFDKSNRRLDPYHNPDRIYVRIIEEAPGISLQDFNSILELNGEAPLGSESRN